MRQIHHFFRCQPDIEELPDHADEFHFLSFLPGRSDRSTVHLQIYFRFQDALVHRVAGRMDSGDIAVAVEFCSLVLPLHLDLVFLVTLHNEDRRPGRNIVKFFQSHAVPFLPV